MTVPLVQQLRFTRNEWRRALDGVSAADASRRFGPMNSIGWIVGHLAWQEQLYWLERAQGQTLAPELDGLVGNGRPASTPPLDAMMQTWQTLTRAADAYLDTLTAEMLRTHPLVDGEPHYQSLGTLLTRQIYHYWYHMGEIMAVRQLLDHTDRPEFVGNIQAEAPYAPS
jgi:uncharacterized damage-inducible protein DinB